MKIFLADDNGNLHLILDKISKYEHQRRFLEEQLILDEGDPIQGCEIIRDIQLTMKQIEEKQVKK